MGVPSIGLERNATQRNAARRRRVRQRRRGHPHAERWQEDSESDRRGDWHGVGGVGGEFSASVILAQYRGAG